MRRGDHLPFEFDGDGSSQIGVALIHGFTGTPYEVRYLGEQLAQRGFRVEAPLLPGHGTSLDDLDRTSWREWVAAVDRTVDKLAATTRAVAVVGQSLGGLLALHAASRRADIAAVASLAAPLWLEGLNGVVARWITNAHPHPLKSRIHRLPKLGGSDVRDPRVKAENPCYPAIPVRALGELMTFMRVVDEALPHVSQPALVLHATHDHTAPVACAERIVKATRAARVRILARSYHLIAVDVERDIVAAEVATFLHRHIVVESSAGAQSCAT